MVTCLWASTLIWSHHLIDKRLVSSTWFIFFTCINFFFLFYNSIFTAEAHFEIHSLNIRGSSIVISTDEVILSDSPSIIVEVWVKEKFSITILMEHSSKLTLLQLLHIKILLLSILARTLHIVHWFFIFLYIATLRLLVRNGTLISWEIKLLRLLYAKSLPITNVLCRRVLVHLKLALN